MTRDISAVLDFGKEIDPLGPFHVEVVNITEDGGGGVTSLTSSTTTIATLAINGDMITCFNTALGSLSRTDVEVDVRSSKWYMYLYSNFEYTCTNNGQSTMTCYHFSSMI